MAALLWPRSHLFWQLHGGSLVHAFASHSRTKFAPFLRKSIHFKQITPSIVGIQRKRYFSRKSSLLLQKSIQQQDGSVSTPIPTAFSESKWEATEFAIHVAIPEQDAPTFAEKGVASALENYYKDKDGQTQIIYSATQLLELGSVWHLPAQDMDNPHRKPKRLTIDNAQFMLQKGDYLRIHHNPRRFSAVHLYNWKLPGNEQSTPLLPSPIVDYNDTLGYLIINKPPECIPVHPTVDNHAENMIACMRNANQGDLDYVTPPHRLDQNTSGLITLATSKLFAAYFPSLNERKTAQQLQNNTADKSMRKDDGKNSQQDMGAIRKFYRCLVCLMPPSQDDTNDDYGSISNNNNNNNNNSENNRNWSVNQALQTLQTYVRDKKVLRHFLEPSVRAPKRFVITPPPGEEWPECLMRIRHVGNVCALRGNQASDQLADSLFDKEQMPPSCQAVVEVEVELLTGRTHQIRGQLSTAGYPLVGDAPYGGASTEADLSTTKLALQCCHLEFLEPDIRTREQTKKGFTNIITDMVPSHRWKSYKLDEAWWTPHLKQYEKALKSLSEEEMTTQAALDIGLVDSQHSSDRSKPPQTTLNPEGLPPQAILAPGRHKYVLVKAIDPGTREIVKWFVKSASPQQCGGPYHQNVADDLVEWIEACGYKAVVTGGGRILYQFETKRALVYGFSYGFGRGDHALAAKIIKEWSDNTMDTAYDDSPDLY